MQSDAAAAAAGGAGLTVPIWLQYIDPAYQITIAALGFAVLVLTVWNKILEIRMKRRAWRDLMEARDAETRDS